jgi:hypothetical protein
MPEPSMFREGSLRYDLKFGLYSANISGNGEGRLSIGHLNLKDRIPALFISKGNSGYPTLNGPRLMGYLIGFGFSRFD